MKNFEEYFNEAILKAPKSTNVGSGKKYKINPSKNKPTGKYGGVYVPSTKTDNKPTTPEGINLSQLTAPKTTNVGSAQKYQIPQTTTKPVGKYGGISIPKSPEQPETETEPKKDLPKISSSGIKSYKKQDRREFLDRDVSIFYNNIMDKISNDYLSKVGESLDDNILKEKILFLYILADDEAVINTEEYSENNPTEI